MLYAALQLNMILPIFKITIFDRTLFSRTDKILKINNDLPNVHEPVVKAKHHMNEPLCFSQD